MRNAGVARIVILGGYGHAGRALTPLLLLHTTAHLVLAGRDAERARRAAEEWNTRFEGGRVAGVRADAADPHSLEAAFAGAGLVASRDSTLLCWSTRFFTRPPYGIVLQLEAEGIAAGASRRFDLFLFHEDGYVFTAVPVAACLLQVLDGSA